MKHANTYHPADSFSDEMLQSIPKKVCYWLLNIGYDLEVPGQYQGLSWSFSEDGGFLIYEDEESKKNIQISWNNTDSKLDSIYSNDQRLENVADNLDFFSRLEEDIYSLLELCEEENA